MPELPEVETMVRGIRETMTGRKLKSLESVPCKCKPITIEPSLNRIRKKIEGSRIESVERFAKRIVIRHSTGDRLVIEPRMTGLMLLDDPPDPDHLRLKWTFPGRERPNQVWFWDRRGLATCRLYTEECWRDWQNSGKVGPDALQMEADFWRERIKSSSRAVKVAMLDQKTIAGIGNLYASEILHASRVHPETRCQQLTRAQIERIAENTKSILQEAIRYEGSTLSDGTYRNALNKSGGYQNQHRVYAKEGTLCSSCQKETVVRIVQAQRSTFFCPLCQSKRRKKS
ncbi:MAG: bifunctional DNA-formamidopyrimidine glycosylase/DNA-(apurinic or apyrimidinic site) lyase [Planctomycetaceae bacterium]|jgi:formamidopyrimidine-DNA glycosylase|nr:bifunctional DNA-formamidopyrimidine glycosylase/DNA-(apurinic or apyrimidinic site) lyase [Planctomycetaceae bacterium]MDG2389768.1 bifunctional DNA-formamidopyrimidine glycosylase/DNA-(apurinic or apyrimidinic site) lyase [Planctomycetaceae bacterium]